MLKQLLMSSIVILASLGTAIAQTDVQPTPAEEIPVPPIPVPSPFPPPPVTDWPFLKLNCVPQGAWCRYLANTTFGVALGYYLGLPFKIPYIELKGVRAECRSTKSSNQCELYYDFPDPSVEKPFFLAVCIDYFEGVVSCRRTQLTPTEEEELSAK